MVTIAFLHTNIRFFIDIDILVKQLIRPNLILNSDGILYDSYKDRVNVIQHNVSYVCNSKYHVKDNIIYQTRGLETYGKHTTDHYTVLNLCETFKIISTFDNEIKCMSNRNSYLPQEVALKSLPVQQIAHYYYHAENLNQYSNDSVDIRWSINTHKLFGKYVDVFIKHILICYKYSNKQYWIPKCILYVIISLLFHI